MSVYKVYLDNLLTRAEISQDSYNKWFKTMKVGDNGRMTGIYPDIKDRQPYEFDGNMLDGSLVDFILRNVTPMLGAEEYDEVFKVYGYTYTGIGDGYSWFTNRENLPMYMGTKINDINRLKGHKPIEEASELELWKIIAISSRYWEVNYKRWYYER